MFSDIACLKLHAMKTFFSKVAGLGLKKDSMADPLL